MNTLSPHAQALPLRSADPKRKHGIRFMNLMDGRKMEKYRIERQFIKKPAPAYALKVSGYYHKRFPIKSLTEQEAKKEMDVIENYLNDFTYIVRNSKNKLGVTHKIERTDNRITVYTLYNTPIITFWIEEEKEDE
ncbi:hypothetical protein [Phocaeicola coprophilus]|jgi:hypothetical protein|uniref:Uncharacterized protein n=2 Tax=Bacteroidaceae TaxID=815 RepID=A0A413T5B5_9BACT|nr:hypothetical protein [Phocaeicola coprophilus]RHA79001.1 hypothetical protein DW921_00630 [Phocaeicola coprophilus]